MPETHAITLDHCRDAGSRLREAAAQAGADSIWPLKAFVGVNLFYWHLATFEQDTDPLPAFVELCDTGAKLLSNGKTAVTSITQYPAARDGEQKTAVGTLYGNVYSTMDDTDYFDGSRDVLRGRLEANGIDPGELFAGKIVLDAGCGGGKFTQAIASYGAASIIAVDIGPENIEFAKQQAAKRDHCAVIEYQVGSVLELPVDDEAVDFVWCNSVGHVTGDQGNCLREVARTLKPGGELFYYVNGRFGLFEVMLETLRGLMDGVPDALVHHYLQCLGVDPGRISWVIACMFAPYEFLPRDDVETLLGASGFTDIRVLQRGIEIDYSERIARGEPFADVKYGEGQLRILARKA